MQKIKMVYVIYDHECDIICVCETDELAQEILEEQEPGMLKSELVPLYAEEKG